MTSVLAPRRPRHLDFVPAKYWRSPKHYRFFAVEENVMFGDEVRVRRMNADLDYQPADMRACSLSAGDFENPHTARWVARMLNKAIGR